MVSIVLFVVSMFLFLSACVCTYLYRKPSITWKQLFFPIYDIDRDRGKYVREDKVKLINGLFLIAVLLFALSLAFPSK